MRGRAVLLITTMAVALLVASGVALAATINCADVGNPCVGTNNNDTMTGTAGFDDMRGRNGGDTMLAHAGADKLFGGRGNDPDVSAGSGNDSVEGQEGDDFLSGEDGNDTYVFRAGWGADRIPAEGEGAGMGTDTLQFRPLLVDGFDPFAEPLDVDLEPSAVRDEVFTLFSDAGKQTLNFPGAVEIERVTGGTARDVIRGNDLANSLSGNDGNDTLAGRTQNDVLSGGLGADDLNGGLGDDKLSGGDGIDRDAYLFQSGWGKDEITHDVAGIDRLSFGQLDSPVTVNLAASNTGPPEVCSGNPCDLVNTVDWPSTVEIENATGGDGDDKLTGSGSANTLYGQAGMDTITGGAGTDTITGGDGNDTINARDNEVDNIDCGPGTDTVNFDNTIDVLSSNCEPPTTP